MLQTLKDQPASLTGPAIGGVVAFVLSLIFFGTGLIGAVLVAILAALVVSAIYKRMEFSSPDETPAPAPAPAPTPAAAPVTAATAETAETPETGQKPESLSAARDGAPDDLKKIRGVGPKLEGLLHSLGFYHFDQIAKWTAAEVAWVDDNLEGFKGRVTRDDWVAQAKDLAKDG